VNPVAHSAASFLSMADAFRPPDALALLEHRAWVRSLARRLLADDNDVDDVEQETWIAALRSGPDEPRALRSWLGAVASRFALQRARGEGRRARREIAASAPERAARSPAEVIADADAHGRVVSAVLALDEPYRTTVLLRHFEGLSVPDVARRMDVPLETTRTRLRRALEKLRAALRSDDGRPLALFLAPLARTRARPESAAHRLLRAMGLVAAAVLVVAVVGFPVVRAFYLHGAVRSETVYVGVVKPADAAGDDATPAPSRTDSGDGAPIKSPPSIAHGADEARRDSPRAR